MRTLITILILAIIITSTALYDAVTGDVSDWWESVEICPCVCAIADSNK